MALAVPLSRFASRVGGGSAFYVRPREVAMNYRVTCPSCGKKVSRWHIFGEPTIYHRCRSCGTEFSTGWAGVIIVVAVELFWFALERFQVISSHLAIALVLVTCVLAVWLLPYFTSVRSKLESDKI